jgi:hypothetical protein
VWLLATISQISYEIMSIITFPYLIDRPPSEHHIKTKLTSCFNSTQLFSMVHLSETTVARISIYFPFTSSETFNEKLPVKVYFSDHITRAYRACESFHLQTMASNRKPNGEVEFLTARVCFAALHGFVTFSYKLRSIDCIALKPRPFSFYVLNELFKLCGN